MLINAVLITVLMVVAVGATGLCTYNPGAPKQGPVQEVDAQSFLSLEARGVDFPVRYPQMPEGWITNSARRSMIDAKPAPVVGWVTPDGGFLQLTQTGAPAERAIAEFDNSPRELKDTMLIDGTSVDIYSGSEARDLWVADAGDVRMLVTGAGERAEFEQLIATALATNPEPGAAR